LKRDDAQRQLSSSPPVVAGGALVMPAGLLTRLPGHGGQATTSQHAAVAAVLRIEAGLGRTPRPATPEEQGYDVESRAADGSPLFSTVRHRATNADTFLITRSELGVARNAEGNHVLALVDGHQVRYVPSSPADPCPRQPKTPAFRLGSPDRPQEQPQFRLANMSRLPDVVSGILDIMSSSPYGSGCGQDISRWTAQRGTASAAARGTDPGSARRGGRGDPADGRGDRGRRLRAVGVPGPGDL